MAKRKAPNPEPELVPDDEIIEAKQVKAPTRKVVESKVITYEQPADESDDLDSDDEPEFELDEKPKRHKPTLKQEKLKLRERWAKKGIAPTGNLRVSIWKFTNEDDPMSGPQADKAFCSKFQTTADAIDEGIHLDAAAKFGPGRYWLMIYLNNQICDQWEFRIAGSSTMAGMNGQQAVVTPDPANPGQVIVQMPAQQAASPIDPFAEFDKTLKMFERFQKVFGGITHPQVEAQPQQPQLTPEQQLASTLLLDPEVKKKAVKSLLGSNGDSGETNTLELVLTHAESIGKAIEGIINGLFTNVQGLRGNNGTAQMAQAPRQRSGHPENQWQDHGQNVQVQEIQATNGQALEGHTQGVPESSISPEDQLLILVLDQCKRRLPAKIAAMRVLALADAIEQQAPWLSLYPVIEMFIQIEPDAAIAFIEGYSEQAKEIASLPHAKEWTGQLQAELKASYDNGGDDGNQS